MKRSLIAGSLLSLASAPVFAGALAMGDLNISALFLADDTGTPLAANASLQIQSESRTGTANSNYNGIEGTGAGPGSLSSTTIAAPIDVQYRCAGPDCGSISGLYGGVLENNTTSFIAPPPTKNYALGDMLISGSAVGGAVTGLTRADASAAGPTNTGGSNATILNSATIVSTFTAGTTFTGRVAVTAAAYVLAWVSEALGETASASAGTGWTMSIRCSVNCGATWSTLTFSPDELNMTATSTDTTDNFLGSFAGTLLSDARTFIAGTQYQLTINQSSNAVVSSVPEPSTVALVGMALVGMAGAARRRRKEV